MQRAKTGATSPFAALSSRLGMHGAMLLTLGIGVALFFGLAVAASQVYSAVTGQHGAAGLDRPLLDFAISFRAPWLNTLLTWYTNVAGKIGMSIIAVAALIALTVHRRSWTPAILIVAAGGGSLLMTVAGKLVFGRDRPPLADAVPPYEYSASFPSGHTLNSTAVIGIIAYLLVLEQANRRARIVTTSVAAVFILTTGVTRVYLGHHWFTDVLFAWLLGFAWLAAIITTHRLVLAAQARRNS